MPGFGKCHGSQPRLADFIQMHSTQRSHKQGLSQRLYTLTEKLPSYTLGFAAQNRLGIFELCQRCPVLLGMAFDSRETANEEEFRRESQLFQLDSLAFLSGAL